MSDAPTHHRCGPRCPSKAERNQAVSSSIDRNDLESGLTRRSYHAHRDSSKPSSQTISAQQAPLSRERIARARDHRNYTYDPDDGGIEDTLAGWPPISVTAAHVADRNADCDVHEHRRNTVANTYRDGNRVGHTAGHYACTVRNYTRTVGHHARTVAHYACAACHNTGASTYNAVAIAHDAHRACADPTAARPDCDIPRVAYPGGANTSGNPCRRWSHPTASDTRTDSVTWSTTASPAYSYHHWDIDRNAWHSGRSSRATAGRARSRRTALRPGSVHR